MLLAQAGVPWERILQLDAVRLVLIAIIVWIVAAAGGLGGLLAWKKAKASRAGTYSGPERRLRGREVLRAIEEESTPVPFPRPWQTHVEGIVMHKLANYGPLNALVHDGAQLRKDVDAMAAALDQANSKLDRIIGRLFPDPLNGR